MGNALSLKIEDLEFKKKSSENLFGQLPGPYPHYLVIRYGAVPFNYKLQARYSKKLRITCFWRIDSFHNLVFIEIDRTEWTHSDHDELNGDFPSRFAVLDRKRFVAEFNQISEVPFESIESSVIGQSRPKTKVNT